MNKKGLCLNNKGFAITGILYTLLILFLLITVSVLGELRSRNNYLGKAISTIENSYNEEYVECPLVSKGCLTDNKTIYNGKYVFSVEGTDLKCYSYLKKGVTITNSIVFTNSACKSNPAKKTVIGVYKIKGGE